MVQLEEITKIFTGDLFTKSFMALDGVSFTIPENRIVGFLGANGAGKTTSIKILMDFVRPNEGRVVFDPKLGKRRSEIAKNIGYLPERPYFYPHLEGREFLYYLGQIAGISKARIKELVLFWGPRFKIEFALDRKIQNYSKGMLQRLGFLATLLHDPKLIILDEPLGGLDPIGRKDLKEVMSAIHREGKTIFFSSHIVSDVEEVCQDVVFLKEGKLQYQGTIEQLIEQTATPTYKVWYRTPAEIDYFATRSVIGEDRFTRGLQVGEVTAKDKEAFVKEVLEHQGEILKLESTKLTLEEIIYYSSEAK